jgi:hypothetical protein
MTHSGDSWTDCEWHPNDALIQISKLISSAGSKMEQDYQTCLLKTHNSPILFTDDSLRDDDLGSNTMKIPTLSTPVKDSADDISEEEAKIVTKCYDRIKEIYEKLPPIEEVQ